MQVETIIQGGAVGLAAFAMYILWKLVANHIKHNTEVLVELKETIKELKNFLQNTLK